MGLHDAHRRFVGALFVDRCRTGHTKGNDDRAVLFFDEILRGDRQVLEAGHRARDDFEGFAVTGALAEFRAGLCSHVVAREHGVDDAYLLYLLVRLRFLGHRTPFRGHHSVGI